MTIKVAAAPADAMVVIAELVPLALPSLIVMVVTLLAPAAVVKVIVAMPKLFVEVVAPNDPGPDLPQVTERPAIRVGTPVVASHNCAVKVTDVPPTGL